VAWRTRCVYSYTKSNQIATMTYPDAMVIDYVRDTQQRVKEVGVTRSGGTRQIAVKNAAYLPAGPATKWQTGNNRTLTRAYDFSYLATSVLDPGPTTDVNDDGLNIGYVYDNASYLKEIETQSTSVIRAKFDYDALGRLLARKNSTNVIEEEYTYDKSSFSLPSKLYFKRHHLPPAIAISRYSPPASNRRYTLSVGFAFRIAVSVRGIGGNS
jgi:hypothetical protein